MKINDRVYVSALSKSRLAGEVGTVRAISARGEVKVENDFGVIGYPDITHCKVQVSDAPNKALYPAKVAVSKGWVVDNDINSMYMTPVKALPVLPKDPTDLLTKPVIARDFLTDSIITGWVSDQWIEEGVELLNIVHNGSFSVLPRSLVVGTMKRNGSTNLWILDKIIN